MTRQVEMSFGDGVRAQEAVVSVEQALANLVDAMTPKETAWRLGVSEALVYKKLRQEERNRFAARELVILLVTAPKLHQRALLDVLARACGFVVDEAPELGPEQVLERLEALLDEELSPKRKQEILRRARGR